MRNALFFIAACACFHWATAQVHVKPHITKDGTFVQGHVRSAPDSTPDNNYGTRPNVNPYTGQQGTQRPSYEQPTFPQPRQQVCGYVNGQYVCR